MEVIFGGPLDAEDFGNSGGRPPTSSGGLGAWIQEASGDHGRHEAALPGGGEAKSVGASFVMRDWTTWTWP